MRPIRWFGESWGAHVCQACEQVRTPVDIPCAGCGEPIKEGDQGIIMDHLGENPNDTTRCFHVKCLLRNLGIGGESP